jgi:hypothetical protein
MPVTRTDDIQLFQQDLDRLQSWCREEIMKNAGKCKFILFSHGSIPVLFQYIIADSDLDRVDDNNDFSILIWVDCIKVNYRFLGFMKRILREFNDPYSSKTLCVAFVWPCHLIRMFIRQELSVFTTTGLD